MENKIVNVLGTPYSIQFRKEKEDPALESCNGYCDETVPEIIVQEEPTEPTDPLNVSNWDQYRKRIVRHELVHAFFFESGLAQECDFASNEILVDWIARQAPKLARAFSEAGAV